MAWSSEPNTFVSLIFAGSLCISLAGIWRGSRLAFSRATSRTKRSNAATASTQTAPRNPYTAGRSPGDGSSSY